MPKKISVRELQFAARALVLFSVFRVPKVKVCGANEGRPVGIKIFPGAFATDAFEIGQGTAQNPQQ